MKATMTLILRKEANLVCEMEKFLHRQQVLLLDSIIEIPHLCQTSNEFLKELKKFCSIVKMMMIPLDEFPAFAVIY